jgi:hypothetical protein
VKAASARRKAVLRLINHHPLPALPDDESRIDAPYFLSNPSLMIAVGAIVSPTDRLVQED